MNEEEKEAIEEFKKQYRLSVNVDYITTEIRNRYIEVLLNLIQKQEKKIKDLKFKNEIYKKANDKLEKVVDEMVYCIDNFQICEYEIQDSFDRKCEYIADDEKPPCKECIKQYFYRKVEEDE